MGNKIRRSKKEQKVEKNKENIDKKEKKDEKDNENNEDNEEENYYSEIIKELKVDTTKIENNLKKINKDDKLIVLIESGSLAPPHKMHLGLMEITKKYIEENDNKTKVIGGYLIPSSDKYVKYKLMKDFISLVHRVNMSKLLTKDSDWLDCLDWGFAYGEEIKMLLSRILKNKLPNYDIKCILVFGIDYYIRNRIPLRDEHICICRPGYDVNKIKEMYPKNLIIIEGKDEDISSTKIRKAMRENDENIINELTCKEIVDYIKNNKNIFEQE